MPLAWWSDLTSFVFTIYAYWVLVSAMKTDVIPQRDWTPTIIVIATVALTLLHFTLHYLA